MSVTMWKAFHNSLSVGAKLRSVGILIMSKCKCCSLGGYEDFDHVLATVNFAREVWHVK